MSERQTFASVTPYFVWEKMIKSHNHIYFCNNQAFCAHKMKSLLENDDTFAYDYNHQQIYRSDVEMCWRGLIVPLAVVLPFKMAPIYFVGKLNVTVFVLFV